MSEIGIEICEKCGRVVMTHSGVDLGFIDPEKPARLNEYTFADLLIDPVGERCAGPCYMVPGWITSRRREIVRLGRSRVKRRG